MELLFKTHDSAAQWRIYRTDDGNIHAEVEFSEGPDAAGTVKLESRGSGLDFGVVERYANPERPDNTFCGAFDLYHLKNPSPDLLFASNPQIVVGEPGGDNVVHVVLMPGAPVVYMPIQVQEFTSPDGDKYHAFPPE